MNSGQPAGANVCREPRTGENMETAPTSPHASTGSRPAPCTGRRHLRDIQVPSRTPERRAIVLWTTSLPLAKRRRASNILGLTKAVAGLAVTKIRGNAAQCPILAPVVVISPQAVGYKMRDPSGREIVSKGANNSRWELCRTGAEIPIGEIYPPCFASRSAGRTGVAFE